MPTAAGASVSRIVLSPGWHRPRLARPLAAASSIPAMVVSIEDGRVAGAESGFDAGRPVEGPRCPADRGDEPVADGAEDLAGRCLGRQVVEHLIHGAQPDHEVVAVVAITEDRVEPR